MKEKKLEKLVLDIYRELYKNSTPSADFDELLKNATIDERGEKIIPFMDYYIDKEKFDEIVENKLKTVKLDEWYKRGVRFNVYLGCSPTSLKKDEKEN
jgi:hypothetical protein